MFHIPIIKYEKIMMSLISVIYIKISIFTISACNKKKEIWNRSSIESLVNP